MWLAIKTLITVTRNYKILHKLKKIATVRKEMDVNQHERLSRVRVMVFNATFNNISAISWWSVLLVEETRVPG